MNTIHAAFSVLHLILQGAFIYYGISAYHRAKWWEAQQPLAGWDNREHAQRNYRDMRQTVMFSVFNLGALAYNGYLAFM